VYDLGLQLSILARAVPTGNMAGSILKRCEESLLALIVSVDRVARARRVIHVAHEIAGRRRSNG